MGAGLVGASLICLSTFGETPVGRPQIPLSSEWKTQNAENISAYGGEVDISKHLRWDESNTLRLLFPREGGAMAGGYETGRQAKLIQAFRLFNRKVIFYDS